METSTNRSHAKRSHGKSVEIQPYNPVDFLDLLNDELPKSSNLRRALDLLIALAAGKWRGAQREKALRELNDRIWHYNVNLQFGPALEPSWVPVVPGDTQGLKVQSMEGRIVPFQLATYDGNVVAYFPGFTASGDFQRLACCDRPDCGRFFLRRKQEQHFCSARCRQKAFKSSHRKQHAKYMQDWRKKAKHCWVGKRRRS